MASKSTRVLICLKYKYLWILSSQHYSSRYNCVINARNDTLYWADTQGLSTLSPRHWSCSTVSILLVWPPSFLLIMSAALCCFNFLYHRSVAKMFLTWIYSYRAFKFNLRVHNIPLENVRRLADDNASTSCTFMKHKILRFVSFQSQKFVLVVI